MKTCLGKIRCCLGRRMGLWLLALSLPATVCLAATAHATDPPHVIYIMMDDLGYGSLSSYGSPFIDTPEIDAFANEGALFTQYYVNSPVCSPSRVSVLTSLPPRFFNIRDALATGANGSHFSQVGIPDYVLTLPEFLKQHQYRTVHLGKWHVGGFEKIADAVHLTPGADIEFLPSAAGFDEWIVRVPSKSRNNYWQEYMQPHDGPGFCVHDEANTTATECRGTETTQHLTEWLVDEAIEVIDSHDPTEPLFLNVWLRAPHLPYNSPASLAGGFTQAEQYELLVEYADEQIGRLVDKAATLGTNTLVFVTSDNGAQSAQPGSPLEPIAPNGDLLGKKGQLWEGGIRVPMMVRWPAQVAPALEVSFPASSFDVFATLVDILGDEVEPLDLAGQSILEQLLDDPNDPKAPTERDRRLFWEMRGRSVRDGQWKTHDCNGPTLLFDMTDCTGQSCQEGQALGLPTFTAYCTNTSNPERVDGLFPEVVTQLDDRFFDWRAQSSEIPWDSQAQGSAVRRGQWIDLPSAGDHLVLCSPEENPCRIDDPRFDFHDGAFTFSLDVLPDAVDPTPLDPRGWIAGKRDSWRLELRDDLRVELTLIEDCGAPGCNTTVLTSTDPLPVDRWSRVVFVVDRGSASLYVNDAVQSAASAFLTVGSNDNPLVLGAESASAQRFVGSLSNLRMFTAVFGSDLLARLDHQSIPWEIGSRRSNTNHQLPEVDGDVVQFLGQQQATLCATESDAVCSEIFPLFDFRHSGFSFGANVRPDGLPASNALLAGKNDAWRLYYLSTGKVRLRVFGLCGGSACTVDVDSTITLEPGQWNHVAFTVTPESDGTQTPRLFVTADSSETVQGSIDSIGGGSKPLTLGSRWTGTSLIETFSGAISGVRLFFGALSDAEVTQLARAEIDWHIRPPVGTPRIADNVFLFDQAETTADQILLCGPPVKVEGGAPVNCPTGGYEHFDLGDRGFTFTAEVRPDPLAPDLTRIVGKDGSFYIHQRPDRTIRLRVFGKDCGGCFVDLNGPALDNGVYTDITFSTTRRTDGDLDVRLFVEDTQVATEVSAPVGLDEIKPLVLGSHSGGKRFRGALRDVRLFARSLTPNDLLLLGP